MTPQSPQFGKPARRRVRAFNLGPNLIEHQIGAKRIKDIIWMTAEDRDAVLRAFGSQAVALPLYKEHRPELGSFGAIRLEAAPDGGLDQVIDYSPDGRALVESGRYMYDSPEIVASAPDSRGRKRLMDVRSGSLVNVPARTGSQPLLMSAKARGDMSKSLSNFQRFLELQAEMEPLLKGFSDDSEEGKAAMAAGEGLGRLTAYAQQQVQVLSPPAADTVQMSAAVHAAAGLGAEVIKMTGSATAEEALAFLQGRDATVMALSAKVVEYGVQAGVLPAAEADRYRKMTPPQLLGHLRASAGAAVIQMTAAAGDGAAPPAPKAEPEEDAEARTYGESVTGGLLGPKLGSK